MRSELVALLATAVLSLPAARAAPAAAVKSADKKPADKENTIKKWEAPVPKVAASVDDWKKLIPALIDQKMYYGALAGARNMLNLFQDLGAKELAYQTIVQLVDLGYPFSTRPLFVPGDIEPPLQTKFGRDYVFYKGLADMDKKMHRWADDQFEKLDKATFTKYIFYQAIQQYGEGKLDEAIETLKKALAQTNGPESLSLARKEARTLARIYYEKQKYEESLDIYQNFLLRLNPVTPGDWLEAAWNLYGLKRYPEALGLLYNLTSDAEGPTTLLEQHVLRALIYREYCSVENVEKLSESFNQKFGKIIDAIKLGEPLTPDPMVVQIEHPETAEYRYASLSIDRLQAESTNVSALPRAVQALAKWLYSTDIEMLKVKRKSLENDAMQVLAKHLVILSESLRFLRFDVIREKYNPEAVFAEVKKPDLLVDSTDEVSFRLHWRQWGDFWRDERFKYRGLLEDRCGR